VDCIDEVEILTSVSKQSKKWVLYVVSNLNTYNPEELLRDVPWARAHTHVHLVTSGVGYVAFDTKEALEDAFVKLQPKSIRALGCDPDLGIFLNTES
jgi:hypothetical protein